MLSGRKAEGTRHVSASSHLTEGQHDARGLYFRKSSFQWAEGLVEGLARGGKMVVNADHLGETQENVKRKSSMAIR